MLQCSPVEVALRTRRVYLPESSTMFNFYRCDHRLSRSDPSIENNPRDLQMIDSSESSSDELLQQALPVDDADGREPPNLYESSQYPEVIVSDKHLKEDIKSPTATEEAKQKPLSSMSREWQQLQAKLFISAKRFDVIKANVKLSPSHINPSSSKMELADSRAWFSQTTPRISHFNSLSQKTVIEILQTLMPLCTPTNWNSSLEPWIYSVLLSLEQPLLPDTCHYLRRLAKSFRKIASKSDQTTSNDTGRRWLFCEIVIAIVAFVFGQLDLVTS
ncbi:gem (nuclear organelle) associated protein 2 [Sparganum proliferum]